MGVRGSVMNTGDLQTIPGIGPSMAQDLKDLGYSMVRDLRNEDPDSIDAKQAPVHPDHLAKRLHKPALLIG